MRALVLPHVASSAAAVRHRLCDELAESALPDGLVDDAALVMTELLSNALRHAAALPGGVVRAGWRQEPDRLVLQVSDGGADSRPEALSVGPGAQYGRGLAIVTALAADWGVRDDGEGTTTVWAALALVPGDGRRAGAVAAGG